jgi:hypothetical protein
VVLFQGNDYKALVTQEDFTGTGWNPTITTLWQNLGPNAAGHPAAREHQ